jgi:myo-inositol-1(or 4)-monophosphatase
VPTRGEAREWTTEAAVHLMGKVKSFRALGAAALHLAYVASGRLDAFWEYDLNAWDLAAGVLLVEEAGGVVREIGGSPYHLEVRNVIAAGSSHIAEELNRALQLPGSLKG